METSQTKLSDDASPAPAPDGGKGLGAATGSAVWSVWPPADVPLEIRLKSGEIQESFYSDGEWWREDETTIHHSEIAAWRELHPSFYSGMEWLGAWLVDHAEGETVTEELVRQWAADAWRAHLDRQSDQGHGRRAVAGTQKNG